VPGVEVVIGSASARSARRQASGRLGAFSRERPRRRAHRDGARVLPTPGPSLDPGAGDGGGADPADAAIGNNHANLYLGYGDSITARRLERRQGLHPEAAALLVGQPGAGRGAGWGRQGDTSQESAEV